MPKLGEITPQALCQTDQKKDIERKRERGQCGISEHQHWYISSWLLYRGNIRAILKHMIEGISGSCSTLRFVVRALWRSVKGHWHEPEGKAEGAQQKERQKRKQAAGDRLVEGAEWMFVFLNAENRPHVINMAEQLWGNLGVRMSFWCLSFVCLAFSGNTMTLIQTNNSHPSIWVCIY